MTIRIVNNKKLEMSNDEFALYKNICKSYDSENTKGSDLFADLFESDDDGIILFLRPPSRRATTMEVFLFLVSLMTQQHLRINYLQIEEMSSQIKNKFQEMEDRLKNIESNISLNKSGDNQ